MFWDTIQTILHYVSGPLIGAFIGLFTNFLAVKMLFRPYKPIKLLGFRLPFTPGIIPKRKNALAHGIGLAVGEDLFTPDDLKELLCSEKIENRLISGIKERLSGASEQSIDSLISKLTDEQTIAELKDKLSLVVAEKLILSAQKMDIAEIIAQKGKEAITEKKASLGMLGMFLTDGIVDPLLDEVKQRVNVFLEEDGVSTALPAVSGEIDIACAKPLNEFDLSFIGEERLDNAIKTFYESAVSKAIKIISSELDICAIVEKKVIEMPIEELEALCVKIMKRELRALVILGGIIGLIIGVINIFV